MIISEAVVSCRVVFECLISNGVHLHYIPGRERILEIHMSPHSVESDTLLLPVGMSVNAFVYVCTVH